MMFYIVNQITKRLVNAFSQISFIKTKWNKKKILKLIELYAREPFLSSFSKIRAWDAPLEEIEKIIPRQGVVLEIGCGDGLLANYLALSSLKRKVIGIDSDRKRIVSAFRGLNNTQFIFGDALKTDLPRSEVVILSYVLHHLDSFESQLNLLRRIAKHLHKDSLLIMAEVNKNYSLKYFLALLVDLFVVPILFEEKIYNPNIHYRRKKDWIQILQNLGFGIEEKKLLSGRPFSDFIVKAVKR